MSYTTEEIKLINKTTTRFYSEVAESFSETRQHEWEGWKKALPFFEEGMSVLDLGCGNRRFSKFLKQNAINVEVDNYDNFDWCKGTDTERSECVCPRIINVDIIESLLKNELKLKEYDVAVCFGVMHHIPTAELRLKLLKELTKSKIVIVSFWQFERDDRIFKKAQETTEAAKLRLGIQNLEENDYFLGWQDRENVFRFCHNFTDEEIEIFKSKFISTEEFTADRCNKYLIIKNA